VVALMEAINAVRPKLWAGRGRDLLGPIASIDVDGTIAATTGGHKAGMDISYKGIWGYAPWIVSLAHTKEVLYRMDANAKLRGIAEALDEDAWSRLERPAAYEAVTGQTRQREPDHKQRIVSERGYLNLALNHEHVA
jgi:hypothetical protein